MKRILIANRGEIAVRIMRTARALGYETVAVYSEADAHALHVELADFAVALPGVAASQTYLDIELLLDACQTSGADGVHPGYGFLSERAPFARALKERGITFIGPPAEAIEAMGSKSESKRLMERAGVPCVPGYGGEDQRDERLIEEAERIGYPVMVKASAGGGGKGMRRVASPEALKQALKSARSEAESAFGDAELLLERAVEAPRHIEVQIFADAHDQVVHLFERDCSVQRRHQKVIEEAPAPHLCASLRERLGQAAVKAAQAIDYLGAGTVEFLLLPDDETFYFLEMNTRLQVEHPVTEMITGQDLVAWQLHVAEGERLPLNQDEITLSGHAIEVRVYAEDPYANFLPQSGRLSAWEIAPGEGIRVDSGVRQGDHISPHYDPMLAKVIAHGADRAEALRRLITALRRSVVLGAVTNLGFLIACLEHEAFRRGGVSTAFIEDAFGESLAPEALTSSDYALGAALVHAERALSSGAQFGPWRDWSSSGAMFSLYQLRAEGEGGEASEGVMIEVHPSTAAAASSSQSYDVILWRETEQERWRVELERDARGWRAKRGEEPWRAVQVQEQVASGLVELALGGRVLRFKEGCGGRQERDGRGAGGATVRAPMSGKVIEVRRQVGDQVERGEVIVVLEAMKMEHELTALTGGVIAAIHVSAGDQVAGREVVCEVVKEA